MAYNNRLGGLQGTAYTGTNANQPPNWTFETRNPTIYDVNSALGDLWMNTVTAKAWVLLSLQGNASSKGLLATWGAWGGGVGDLISLTPDTGTPVYGDSNQNINIVGGTGIATTGAISPNTITISTTGDVATSYITNPATGTAVPSAGVLTFEGAGGITASASGSTITLTGSGGTVESLTTSTDGHVVTPTAGNINLQAGTGISITGTVGPDTVTIASTSATGTSAFRATQVAAVAADVTGDNTNYQVIYDTVSFDVNGDYNNTTGVFTAPYNGIYFFSGWVVPYKLGGIDNTFIGAYAAVSTSAGSAFGTVGNPYAMQSLNGTGLNSVYWNATITVKLNAGDTASMHMLVSGGTKTVGTNGGSFSGFLITRT